jgi:hypothetical protein
MDPDDPPDASQAPLTIVGVLDVLEKRLWELLFQRKREGLPGESLSRILGFTEMTRVWNLDAFPTTAGRLAGARDFQTFLGAVVNGTRQPPPPGSATFALAELRWLRICVGRRLGDLRSEVGRGTELGMAVGSEDARIV